MNARPHVRRLRRVLFPAGGRDQSGFTLAELIVALVIETIIFGALAGAFVVVLNGGTSVNESLKRSNDARTAASYIVSDARNSSGPQTSLSDTTSCADPSPPVVGAQTAVVRFGWTTASTAGTTTPNIANYVLASGNLLRRYCQAGVLVTDMVLATNVATVTVACSPIADCSGAAASVTVTIAETLDRVGSAPYTYSLTAAFRQVIGNGTPLPPVAPVILLGGPCSAGTAGVDLTGSGTLKIYGHSYINTADGSTCTAMSLENGGSYSAGGTSILQGGTCVAAGGLTCPPFTSYSPAFTDPYASLAPPSTSGRPAESGCAGTAQPGVYASVLSIQGGSTCTLASGIYILQAGLDIGNGATLKSAAGGVLIYLTGGRFTVEGGGNVSLSAMTTGAWAKLVVWQAAADPSIILFNNGGTITLNGTLYAPSTQLNIQGGAVAPVITAIVVQTIAIGNNGDLTAGAPSATPLSITPAALPAWTVNRAYSTTLTAVGGDGNYTWAVSGLPTGLTFNAATAVISGTPTAVAASPVTATLTDALGDDPATNAYTLRINAAPSITTASLPPGEKTLIYSTTLAVAGGTTAFIWTSTALPAGLTLDNATGVISGTPTAVVAPSVTFTLTDASGATVTKAMTLTVTAAPTITSVTLANGTGVAGTIGAGDTVTVVFSDAMSVGSFCSAWSNDDANQSLVASNDVKVTVTNATNDTLTVTSTACGTFNFGSINLASASYVSATATFAGATTSASKITWTTATHTLVITLGAKTAGTVAAVTTSTPIYTASSAIADSAGAKLSNSPFTLTAGKKF